ncbi:hypothetical protein QR98_0007550 [Sarcoptes scabiei]|uniref:Uncharacterized protein n=1 Tax=Sarcoptes scabiei TaxID=52283 RepID=A0A131ZU92_SARSC|nr:hypothetical protein QR98_0007550 [Sarcoptes scabiei]
MSDSEFKVEFSVQMKCDECRKKIISKLSDYDSIIIDLINVDEQRLVIRLKQNSPSPLRIQEMIENELKINTIIRGASDDFAAVAELRGSDRYSSVIGVVRFIQNSSKQTLIDGIIEDDDLRLIFQKKIDSLDLVSMIGRSLAIKTSDEIIAAGIIARASKIYDNSKKVCLCSGKTLWQERELNRKSHKSLSD